jgi:hypothetical protein
MMLGREVATIPLPHPSGASTWVFKPKNKILLNQAVCLLKKELEI